MGTSAISIFVNDEEIYCVSLGDCKAVIFNEKDGNYNSNSIFRHPKSQI
jgi:serine/threonine protein phosphatase PrpC